MRNHISLGKNPSLVELRFLQLKKILKEVALFKSCYLWQAEDRRVLVYQRILFFFFVSEAMAAETCCKVKEQERVRSFCLAEIRSVFSLRSGREIAERCEAILFGQLVRYSQDRGSFFLESQDKRVR